MGRRTVVITGLGVVAPNAITVGSFLDALQRGSSGIRYHPELELLNFSCRIAGKPILDEETIKQYFDDLELRNLNNTAVLYGVIAGINAWTDAGLVLPHTGSNPDWIAGTIFGSGSSGLEKLRQSIMKIDEGQTRRLGSTAVSQTMVSSVSAYLGSKLALGNQVTANSSACTTGTESLLMCYERISSGLADRMLSGSCSEGTPYMWAGFDAMKVCTTKFNERPEAGSRPMSATAGGFVPGSGAGALLLESLESAQQRGARIYAVVRGGCVNSGGQRNGGTMTAPNSAAVQQCIRSAVIDAGITADDIDAVSGHLTATGKDATEINNWAEALGRTGERFPYISAVKSHIGHCLAASGSIECVAAVLQLEEQCLFPNLNCEDLHPEIAAIVAESRIPLELQHQQLRYIAKASFGFGDVNACVILEKYNQSSK